MTGCIEGDDTQDLPCIIQRLKYLRKANGSANSEQVILGVQIEGSKVTKINLNAVLESFQCSQGTVAASGCEERDVMSCRNSDNVLNICLSYRLDRAVEIRLSVSGPSLDHLFAKVRIGDMENLGAWRETRDITQLD